MILLNAQQMWEAVSLEEVMTAMEDAYMIHRENRYVMPDRMVARRDSNMMLYMPCFLDQVIGTKMLAEFPGNPAIGQPYLSGLMILNDAVNGQTLGIMDGGTLTAMRTGANGGLGIRYLSRPDSHSVGLVGCGTQGLHQLVYACAVRDIRDIYLFDAFKKDLSSFVQTLQDRLHNPKIAIHPCSDITELVSSSDILISTTQATDPVYPDDTELLRGKCFIAIGSWQPHKRELPDAVSRLVKNIYTELPYACEESGDLKIPLDSGVLSEDRVLFIEDLIKDKRQGIEHDHAETTCFKSVGMGVFDARVAQLVYENALARSIGQKIDW